MAAPITTTLSQLFGSDSKISRNRETPIVDAQEFAFSGIDGLFVTALGGRGRTVTWSGLLRGISSSRQAAAAIVTGIADNLKTHHREKTLITLNYESLPASDLYLDPAPPTPLVGVISAFAETAPREASIHSIGVWWVLAPFSLTFRILK